MAAPAGTSVKWNFNFGVVLSMRRRTSSATFMTAGPMPSPARTAMWKLSLAPIVQFLPDWCECGR